jgi:quercetin dioxygenase-like cupin family protein
MKVVKIGDVSKELFVHPLFTGKEVTIQVLMPESNEYDINIVNFGKGVRNKFHAHTREQILIVIGGRGIVATEAEEKVVTEGDVILIPANEKHWHGADKDSEFSHLYVMRTGAELTELED